MTGGGWGEQIILCWALFISVSYKSYLIYMVTVYMLSTYSAINRATSINKVWIGVGSEFNFTCGMELNKEIMICSL